MLDKYFQTFDTKLSMTARQKIKNLQGFTLIELLIVIAILGVLAVVVLLALNPAQQLARTRDSGRISAVTQLGHAIEAYATSNNGVYPAVGQTWIATLQSAGEISAIPTATNYSAAGAGTGAQTPTACGPANRMQANLCYDYTAGTGAIVYARLEAQANYSRCTTAGNWAYAVYSTAAGRGGIVCTGANGVPATGVTTFLP